MVAQKVAKMDIESESRIWKLLYLYWFIILFRPEWFLSHYLPFLKIIRMIPTLICIILFISIFLSGSKRQGYRTLGVFVIIVFFSTLFAENTGRARIVLRNLTELYLMAVVTLSVVDDRQKLNKIINLYLFHFLFIGVGGLYGFISTGRGIVPWDWIIAEEDSFGPLMCMGLAFSLFYALSRKKDNIQKLSLIISFICIVGVVLSFARGAFLVLIFVMCYFLLKYQQRGKAILMLGLSGIIMIVAVSYFFPDNAFWQEMGTISEGTETGTGRDRKVLWSLAWEEFKDYPLIGVGPYNFGVVSEHYLNKVSDKGHYAVGKMYGRALHNGFFQILCELGVIGALVFLNLLWGFHKNNLKIEKYTIEKNDENEAQNNPRILQLGFSCCMIAFLLNAFFYDIIFYNWLWILLILNQVYTKIMQQELDAKYKTV